MLNVDVFKDTVIEEEDHDQALQKEQEDRKGNPIPKGIVSIEKFFYLMSIIGVTLLYIMSCVFVN